MTGPTASLVIVSRERPQALMRCLDGVAQLWYPALQVIVVADPPGLSALAERADAASLRAVPFDQPNISAARNIGIAAAGGEVVAFIDDDAVPEPTWLMHLLGPFANPEVAATGGYVIGRNGFSLQWAAREVDRSGVARSVPLAGDAPVIRRATDSRSPKTEGTNMAVRRSVLLALGGFDPAFRFYLDETDLNLRLGQAGHATAFVPLARVHHGFAASSRRRADRLPLSLHEIGASTAVFLAKHAQLGQIAPAEAALRAEQRARLEAHVAAGRCTAGEMRALLQTLEAGLADGRGRSPGRSGVTGAANPAFTPRPPAPTPRAVMIAGRLSDRSGMERAARDLRAEGAVVTLLTLTRGTLFHRMSFGEGGIWRQQGGQFGRSDRDMALVTPMRFATRARREADRLTRIRHPDHGELQLWR